MEKSGRSKIGGASARPERYDEILVGTTEIGVRSLFLVNPVLGVFIEEDCKIGHMSKTLKGCIEIAGISEISDTDESFLWVLIG